jgi:hypothetical protein
MIDRIGDKIRVTGERGQWHVVLDVEIGGYIRSGEVRLGGPGLLKYADPTKFQEISLRETAREVRDAVQAQMCRTPKHPIWIALSDDRINGTQVVRPFTNKSWAVIEFCAADFDCIWKLPKHFPTLVGRKRPSVRRAA